MLKVEFKEREKIEEGQFKNYIIVNDIPDFKSGYTKGKRSFVEIHDKAVLDIVLQHSFKEVAKHFRNFIFFLKIREWDSISRVTITNYNPPRWAGKPQNPIILIRVQLKFDLMEWNKPFSIKQMSAAFEKLVNAENDKIIKYIPSGGVLLGGGEIEFVVENDKLEIQSVVDRVIEKVNTLIVKVKNETFSLIDHETLSTYFHFPENIKTACKQYLIYFSQFLKDLGIEAETEIKEEAHETLFRVIPKDKSEALDKIREALDIYLNAPGYENFEMATSNTNNIAVMQWQANIFHLKSQLTLLSALIQTKDATIEALLLSNYQFKTELDKLMIKESDKDEDIIKGVVKVKKLEGKGFSINLPEIIRRLKRKL